MQKSTPQKSTPPPAAELPRRTQRSFQLPRVVSIAAAAVVIAALHLGREVLVPIALAILLSFLLAPIVSRLERWGMGRVPAVLSAVAAVMAVLATLGWVVVGQVSELAERLPEYNQTLHRKFDDLREAFGNEFGRAATLVEELGDLEAKSEPPPSDVVQVEVAEKRWTASRWIQSALWRAVGALVFAGALSLFVTFMLLQREALRDRFIWLIGDDRLRVTTQMIEEASRKVSQYLFAQLIVNGTHGALVAIGLTALGVPDSLLWGLLAGLLRFLPYVGPWIGAICPILVSFAVFDGWAKPLGTVGLFLVLELITNNVFEPLIYASRTGLSSLAILVSALFWAWLWGGFGLVLSTPLTVCLVVMGKHVPQFRFFSVVLGDQPVLSASARLYQRLLAGDQDGAWDVLVPELEQKPLVEAFDQTVLPALRLAAYDCRQGELEEDRREDVERSLAALLEEASDFQAALPGAENETAMPREREPGARLDLLCVPTTDAIDQAASLMLCEVLRREGFACEVASELQFAAEILDVIEQRAPALVCVSHVPPPALAPIRYLCKRIVERYPDIPVIAAPWTMENGERRNDLRLPREGRILLASSLAQARAHALEFLQATRVAPEKSSATEPSTRTRARGTDSAVPREA